MHFNAIPIEERMASKFVRDERGCWNWTAGKIRNGYGVVKHNGKMQKAHRVSYELQCGPIPNGMLVCHHCDNPSCINPAHLFLGSHADNMADMNRKGRHQIKLTKQDVLEIRTASGPHREIAAKYKISVTHVGNIRAGRRGSPIYSGGPST